VIYIYIVVNMFCLIIFSVPKCIGAYGLKSTTTKLQGGTISRVSSGEMEAIRECLRQIGRENQTKDKAQHNYHASRFSVGLTTYNEASEPTVNIRSLFEDNDSDTGGVDDEVSNFKNTNRSNGNCSNSEENLSCIVSQGGQFTSSLNDNAYNLRQDGTVWVKAVYKAGSVENETGDIVNGITFSAANLRTTRADSGDLWIRISFHRLQYCRVVSGSLEPCQIYLSHLPSRAENDDICSVEVDGKKDWAIEFTVEVLRKDPTKTISYNNESIHGGTAASRHINGQPAVYGPRPKWMTKEGTGTKINTGTRRKRKTFEDGTIDTEMAQKNAMLEEIKNSPKAHGIREKTVSVRIDPVKVEQLCAMGFVKSDVERALKNVDNDIEKALNFLL